MHLSNIFVCMIFILRLNEAAEVKFTNVVCKGFNESMVIMNICRLRAINRYRTIFNLNSTLLHATSDVELQVQIFKKANGYKPWLIKFSLDVCRFLRKPYNPVAIVVYKMIKNFTNFDHKCPYKGPILVNGLYLQYDMVPTPWPSGEFLVDLTFVVDRIKLVSTKFYFYVVED